MQRVPSVCRITQATVRFAFQHGAFGGNFEFRYIVLDSWKSNSFTKWFSPTSLQPSSPLNGIFFFCRSLSFFLSGRWVHSVGACNHANGLYLIVSLPVPRAWLCKLVYACHHDLFWPSGGSRGLECSRTIACDEFLARAFLCHWVIRISIWED